MKKTKILAFLLLLITLLSAFSSCAGELTLGVAEGSLYDGYSKALYPQATINTYSNFADVLYALKQGKIDGCMLDEPNYNAVKRTEPSIDCEDVPEYDVEIGFGFQKNANGNVMAAQMNALLAELRASGQLDTMIEYWYGATEPTETLAKPDFSDNPTSIRVAIDNTRKPFVYLKNGEYAGFEVEVFYLYCEKYGYKPTIEDVAFSSGITGLATGMYDLVAGGLYMTPARKESVNFSEPYMYADVVMVQRAGEDETSFWAGMKDGFSKTFIDEDRWKLIVEGILTTLLITACSAVVGTLLGFGIYLLCRACGKVAKKITAVFTVLAGGTPIVVVLMIFYYVIFGRADIGGTLVSIIAFSLTMAAFVYEKLTVTVDSIDKGQTEAAQAMGFSNTGLFFHIILPQALKLFMPLYQTELGALLQATAVVGYIAVRDLTQISDIIRSNTYEAFFPLISSALIYLLLTFAISKSVQLLIRKIEPKNRKKEKILKGVDQK